MKDILTTCQPCSLVAYAKLACRRNLVGDMLNGVFCPIGQTAGGARSREWWKTMLFDRCVFEGKVLLVSNSCMLLHVLVRMHVPTFDHATS